MENFLKGSVRMIRLMKCEWKKIRTPVIVTTVLLSIIACILSGTLSQSYRLDYELEAWEVGTEILNFLFPLFVVIPICFNMYYERKNNFLLYTMTRVNKGKYLKAKWVIAALSAFVIIFIPYFLSAIFTLYVKAPSELSIRGELESPFTHVLLDLFTNQPLLYAFILSCLRGLIGIFVMSMGFVFSMYIGNIFVILTGPFIYVIIENFVLSILGKPGYRLVTAFDPTTIMESMITVGSFIVPLILISFVTVIVWLYFKMIKKTVVFKV